jgi:hypothetical protein
MDSCICSEGIRVLEAPWRAIASTGRAEIHASLLHQCTDSVRGKARDQVVQQVLVPRLPEDHPVHRERAPKRVQPETVSAQGQERYVALDGSRGDRNAVERGWTPAKRGTDVSRFKHGPPRATNARSRVIGRRLEALPARDPFGGSVPLVASPCSVGLLKTIAGCPRAARVLALSTGQVGRPWSWRRGRRDLVVDVEDAQDVALPVGLDDVELAPSAGIARVQLRPM